MQKLRKLIKEINPTVMWDRGRKYYLLPFFREYSVLNMGDHPSWVVNVQSIMVTLSVQSHLRFQNPCLLEMCVNSGYLKRQTRGSIHHDCAVLICACTWMVVCRGKGQTCMSLILILFWTHRTHVIITFGSRQNDFSVLDIQ